MAQPAIRYSRVRSSSDISGAKVAAALERLESDARGAVNLMPAIRDAVMAYATVGEISDRLREVFGTYQPPRGF